MYKARGIWFSLPKKQMFKCVNLKIVPQAWWAVSFGKQSFTCATFSRQWEDESPEVGPLGEPWRFKVRSGAMISMGGSVYYIVGIILCMRGLMQDCLSPKWSIVNVFQGLDHKQLPKKKKTLTGCRRSTCGRVPANSKASGARSGTRRIWDAGVFCGRRKASPESWLMFFGE